MTGNVTQNQSLIKNPLTVIAVFAGLAEVSATIALPQLQTNVQVLFVWFVMLFPTLLVALFFFVLWHKHHVLYAPSDFSDEDNFMRQWVSSPNHLSIGSKIDEIEEAITDEIDVIAHSGGETTNQLDPSDPSTDIEKNLERGRVKKSNQRIDEVDQYYVRRLQSQVAEDLVIKNLSRTRGLNFLQNVALAGMTSIRYDAIAEGPDGAVIVEVKLLSTLNTARRVVRRELERAALMSTKLPADALLRAKLIIAIVFSRKIDELYLKEIEKHIEYLNSEINSAINVEFIFYDFLELKVSERAWT